MRRGAAEGARLAVLLSLGSCTPRGTLESPPDASVAASAPNTGVDPPKPEVSSSENKGAARLASDVAARELEARERFGPKAHVRVLGGTFVLVQPDGPVGLSERAAALIDRALPPLFQGRFTKHPDDGVTTILFATHAPYAAYRAEHLPPSAQDAWGFYDRSRREIAADVSGGDDFLPTLTHEIVHALVQTDFPFATTWLEEGIASLYEAPQFPPDGGIRGTPRNRRLPRLLEALRSSREREHAGLDVLFALGHDDFEAVTDAGANASLASLHYAMAREMVAWMDEQGKLWPFYRAWRSSVLKDPSGELTFKTVIGSNPREATAAWVKWVKGE